MPSPPPLILVVGMHRSGTSLLGSLLQGLGVELPGELIAADHHNPEGYFEWQELAALQERLLIDLDRWWPSAQGCLALPEGWLQHPATRAVRAQLADLLRPEVARQIGPWAIKDPRTSRLLPLWLDVAAELGVPLRLLLAVRDPAEVARSLISRDGPITGMDLDRAQQLWWRHNLEPVHAAPATLPLAVVDFEAWFSQPETQLQRLLEALPELRPSAEQCRQTLALIQPKHRRSLATAAQLPLHRSLRQLHGDLLTPGQRRWPAATPPPELGRSAALPASPEVRVADPASWPGWLERRCHFPAPRHPGLAALAPQALISLCGVPLTSWQAHLWLQRLPIPDLGLSSLADQLGDPHNLPLKCHAAGAQNRGLERIAINVELPPPDRVQHWLAHLRGQQAIWDPDAPRVGLLRALGLPAYWLDPSTAPNGWLDLSAGVADQWGACFGLPQPLPCHCLCLGSGGEDWEHALAAWEAQLGNPVFHYHPQLPLHAAETIDGARLLASWLMSSASAAQFVVALGDQGFGFDPAISCLRGEPLRHFRPPLTPAELLAELQGRPVAAATDPASPGVDLLLDYGATETPSAAVVISLYNYADRIELALDSVAAQTLQPLELVVVDDASSDSSAEVVRLWLERQASRFCRVQLLRHQTNAGLAAARNTAFSHCTAEWAFVLDADNLLFPEAVSACLGQARLAGSAVAVVHPFVEVIGNGRHGHDGRSMISRLSWQRQAFHHGNVIDAMALVRCRAWQAVGGYSHIDGGWEDFDFWCKLIDANFHGVLCPRVLARYHTHSDSMTATSTASNWRPLSRCLQQRHPWLSLPYAL
jgi:GT2 family glycosyltransferase